MKNTSLHPKERFCRTAFTLIELLVAIAIVGILAALILPTAIKILERGAIAKSASNLRQIGVAVSAYVTDHNGTLPSKNFADVGQNWIAEAYQYCYDKTWPDFIPFATGENMRKTIFFSPALKSNEAQPWRSYGWNGRLQIAGETPPKLVNISNPPSAILCGDVRNLSNLDYLNVNYRNNGKALMLMADFHVQAFTPAEIPANFTDPMWRPFP